MKLLVTGCSGFVGRYLIEHVLDHDCDATIVGADVSRPAFDSSSRFSFREINLLDSASVVALIGNVQPNCIVHLAAFSSVGFSWRYPIESFRNNTNIFLHLLEAVREKCPSCRILSVGSSEEYGVVSIEETPLSEDRPLRPASPYAVARIAQEGLSLVYAAGFDTDIVCTRSFNHVGVGQSDQFVVSGIAKKFAEYLNGTAPAIYTGDTSIVRDFLDVRDVVRAYHLLLKMGHSGQSYNICSGTGYSIQTIISMFIEIVGRTPPIQVDPRLLRPVENRVVIGSHDKLHALTGWKPQFNLKQTLSDMLDDWKGRI